MKMKESSEYEEQAQAFLQRYNLTLSIRRGPDKCPPWEDKCHTHGIHYLVTIRSAPTRRGRNPESPGAMSVSFSFWGSINDRANNKTPNVYDILACVSSDAHSPTDPDEVVEEYGEIKPSVAIAIAERAKELQIFFTDLELAALAEIQ